MSETNSSIEPILTLSTGHLGEVLVTAHGTSPSFMDQHAAMKGEHGWLLWTGGDHEPMFLQQAYEGINAGEALNALSDILKAARGLGCSYVLFDNDGELLNQFPVFEW
jgi:hypothetical protein